MTLELMFDVLILLLLPCAIFMGWKLHQRLEILRSGQAEMAQMIAQLQDVTAGAQKGISDLRQAAEDADDLLRSRVSKARALADELALITEAGDNLADRLDRRLSRYQAVAKHQEAQDEQRDSVHDEPDFEAKKQLLASLRNVR